MNYMSEDLPRAESLMVIFHVHKSKWFIITPLFLGVVAFILLNFVVWTSPDITMSMAGLISMVLLFVFLLSGFIIWADWNTTHYILTGHTLEKETGFITRTKTYISLHDLSKIECSTGILGDLFNYGTIFVESETSETPLYLKGVPSPHRVMELIREARSNVPTGDKY